MTTPHDATTPGPLIVRPISEAEHLRLIAERGASFLQTPAWGEVKADWRHESVGWFDGSRLVGAALVLYRQLPRIKRYLAYLPEGPVIDWDDDHLSRWLDPLVGHLRSAGAFGVRIGPPVVTARWAAPDIKAGLADEQITTLAQLPPTDRSAAGAAVVSQLQEAGWQPQGVEGGFAAGQPRHNFWLPLTHADGTAKTEDDVLKGMNQLWRRNIKKSVKAGVKVSLGGAEHLPEFHALYAHTAERDHFTPRPLHYFRTMYAALSAEAPERIRLFLAHHEGTLVAATIWIRVGRHTWYSYGASSTEKREVRGSNAIQWEMIRTALEEGADVYDLRGITDTLDPGDPHAGLIGFKVGTGGEVVEYAGEWDLPISRALYAAFALYLKRRG